MPEGQNMPCPDEDFHVIQWRPSFHRMTLAYKVSLLWWVGVKKSPKRRWAWCKQPVTANEIEQYVIVYGMGNLLKKEDSRLLINLARPIYVKTCAISNASNM